MDQKLAQAILDSEAAAHPAGPYTVPIGEEQPANARLIAAAPELLEALQELFAYFEFGDVMVTSSKIEEISAAEDKARVAILKATSDPKDKT